VCGVRRLHEAEARCAPSAARWRVACNAGLVHGHPKRTTAQGGPATIAPGIEKGRQRGGAIRSRWREHAWRAARSRASWPIWFEEKEAMRSSTETAMGNAEMVGGWFEEDKGKAIAETQERDWAGPLRSRIQIS
jgi:hypothetical protein